MTQHSCRRPLEKPASQESRFSAKIHKGAGFLLVEVMMGLVLFSLFLLATGMVLMNGQESTEAAGDRVRAVFLAERSLEASRDVRGTSFAALADGRHGVRLGASGVWELSGNREIVLDDFFTDVTFSTIAPGLKRAVAQTTWRHGTARSGSVLLTTDFTDWRASCTTGGWSAASEEWRYTPGGGPSFRNAAVVEDRAYIASGTAPLMHILNLSTRASTTYDLGGLTATAVAVRGKRLYILTSDANAELRVFDVANLSAPAPLSTPVSVDIAGTPTSLAVIGNTLYVGLTTSGSPEIVSYDISNSGAVVPLKQGDVATDVRGIALTGTAAYLALFNGAGELGIVDTAHANLNPMETRNFTAGMGGDQPALSAALSGTGLLLGCQKNASGQGDVWFSEIINGNPETPLHHIGSGSIVGVAIDPIGAYAFLAADSTKKALQIVNMTAFTAAGEVYSFNSPPPSVGRSVFYDPVRDRAYLITSSEVIIFQPGGIATRPCQ